MVNGNLAELSDNQIKEEVCRQIESTDKGVRARKTSYFNNTYSPDIVLEWGGSGQSRHVFLRADSNPEYLKEDLSFIPESTSMMIPLNTVDTSDRDDEALDAAARQSRILVTPLQAVATLDPDDYDTPFAPMVSHAVLTGGRGYISSEKARSSITTISTGVRQAGTAQSAGIEEAIDLATSLLDTPMLNSITGLMQAMWLAGGGRWDEFPVPVAATAKIDSSSLTQLLSMEGFEDDKFWNSISGNITMEKLLSSEVRGRSHNLEQLMRFSWESIKARVCKVIEPPEVDSSRDDDLHWSLEDYGLRLDLEQKSVLFSDFAQADLPDREVSISPSLDQVRTVAEDIEVHVSAVNMGNEEKRVTYSTNTDENIFDEYLQGVDKTLGKEFEIVSVEVAKNIYRTPMKCTFENAIARGRSSSKFTLLEFASTGVPFLLETEDDQRKLADLVPKAEVEDPIDVVSW